MSSLVTHGRSTIDERKCQSLGISQRTTKEKKTVNDMSTIVYIVNEKITFI